jgi:2-polyprenyl-3-methyl-5-hydroxy-6-metoxy-1,4-benzoquinol methylase
MANTQKIEEAIDQLVKVLAEFKQNLKTEDAVVKTESMAVEVKAQSQNSESLDDFESLKMALLSDKWPEAVNPNLICQPDNEDDKLERGRGIVELMIEEDLKGLKVLDFGCGEGQCAYVASEYSPSSVVGYDVKEFEAWKKYQKDGLAYTTNFQDVLAKGPFDVIILFDVIDHVKGEEPTSVLSKARSALSENGKIYMRCHPFISKHGTHLYHDLNKAYAHLVFTKEELEKIIPVSKYKEESIGITRPILSYNKFIEDANLQIITRRDITSKVEPFFKIPKISERIMKATKFSELPEFQMGMDFLDYVLKR